VVFVILLHANLRLPFGPPELAQALGPRLQGILFRSGYYAVIACSPGAGARAASRRRCAGSGVAATRSI